MSRTKISWADYVWNPVVGCTKVSPGCANCYAVREAHRMAGNPNPKIRNVYEGLTDPTAFGGLAWTGQVRCLAERLDEPRHWRQPGRVFVCSMADLFHDRVPGRFINLVWNAMFNDPGHDYLVLTKRPQNLLRWTQIAAKAKCWPIEDIWPDWIWIGVTAENQEQADQRIPPLLQTPAAVRFVSVEPMLGPVDLGQWLNRRNCALDPEGCQYLDNFYPSPYRCDKVDCGNWQGGLHWVIAGGETGPGARPMHPDWVRSLRDQCNAAKVPFFFKQWGRWEPSWGGGDHLVYPDGHFVEGTHDNPDAWQKHIAEPIWRRPRRAPDGILDGATYREFPETATNSERSRR